MFSFLHKNLNRRPVRFILIGGWNTAFGYALFAGLYAISVRLHLHYLLALIFSQIISVTQAYFLYKYWVFKTYRPSWFEYFRFSAIYAVQTAANLVLLPLAISLLHLHPLAAQAIVIPLLTVISYLGHLTISFRLNSLGTELQ